VYGIDLREALWGKAPIGTRRLWALTKFLPRGAQVHLELEPSVVWTQEDELLATLIEVVDVGNRTFIKANSKQGTKQPKPIVIPRPGRKSTKRMSSIEEQKKYFGKHVRVQEAK
jgi:hypothetical protein